MMRWLVALLICLTAVVAEARDRSGLHVLRDWQSKHFRDHPLVGKFYSKEGKDIGAAEVDSLKKLLSDIDYFLIGEVHDNPDHHRWQARFLRLFAVARDAKPTVVFEMVPRSFQTVLDSAKFEDTGENGNLGKRLDWEKRGWPSWPAYSIIFTVALEDGLSLSAGNLDRSTLRDISKKGIKSLSAKESMRYGLAGDLPEALNVDLAAELKTSHCGLLPEASIPAMIDVQRLRDGVMADAMVIANDGGGSILIAGNGHVRKDRGVPLVLRKREPGAKILSIGLIEVDPEGQTFDDYGLTNPQGDPLYDFVLFTPKADLTDHCAELRKKLSKDNDQTKRN